ncbi:hypothetical protein [Janthinobacterium sp. RB2R34]|uniref:hypothetical protein n=1 Tax=Janthinobacterium sp. RB2R34 TaxID=3424193 RepID=UPI003F51BFB0
MVEIKISFVKLFSILRDALPVCMTVSYLAIGDAWQGWSNRRDAFKTGACRIAATCGAYHRAIPNCCFYVSEAWGNTTFRGYSGGNSLFSGLVADALAPHYASACKQRQIRFSWWIQRKLL